MDSDFSQGMDPNFVENAYRRPAPPSPAPDLPPQDPDVEALKEAHRLLVIEQDELVMALARALTLGLVRQPVTVTPCEGEMYRVCPLAAVMEETVLHAVA